jgi:hypothetical protein
MHLGAILVLEDAHRPAAALHVPQDKEKRQLARLGAEDGPDGNFRDFAGSPDGT